MTPLTELSDEHISELARAISTALAEQRDARRPWDRYIQIVIGLIAIVSLIFTFGVNYGRISTLEKDVETLKATVSSDSQSISAQKTDTAVINNKLDNIQKDVANMNGKIDRIPVR